MAKSSRGVLGWIGCGCLGVLLLCGGGGAGIFLLVTNMMRGSEPYQVALHHAQADDKVKQDLGAPLEAGFWVSGSVSTSGGSGLANLAIPVHGPKGRGTLYVDAHRESGRWVFDTMKIDEGAGRQIDLLARDSDEDTPDEPGVQHL